MTGGKANTRPIVWLSDKLDTCRLQRSLQQRLDDFVTLKSFGADGDGTDQTAQLQRAIDQIFLNSASLLDLTGGGGGCSGGGVLCTSHLNQSL